MSLLVLKILSNQKNPFDQANSKVVVALSSLDDENT